MCKMGYTYPFRARDALRANWARAARRLARGGGGGGGDGRAAPVPRVKLEARALQLTLQS